MQKKENIKDNQYNVKKYLIKTFGCQMNEHDSEKISWVLENINYTATEVLEEADFIIYNTCLIRENAELKVYGHIGALKALKRKNPDLIIAVCGCMMQNEEIRNMITSKHKHVDLIFGTNNIHKLPQLIENHLKTGETVIDILEDTREIDETVDANRKYSYKAFVNIMYGCNNFCTYCVVPYTRGRELSRDPDNILDEIKELAKNGCKEVTLLGQNVNSYGNTLDKVYTFPELLRDINDIEGIERIRFMTSHPKDLSDELIKCYGELENLSPHLHIPIQSGSNRILEKMNRKYSREDILDKIRKLKKVNPDIALTTDIIVGFPGETEEDFLETLELVKQVQFQSAYTFIYSIREGTVAADMDGQIDYKVKHDRFQRITDALNEMTLGDNKKIIGKTLKVLAEDISKNNPDILTGRTEEFKLVNFKGDNSLIGEIVDVVIDDVKTFALEGTVI